MDFELPSLLVTPQFFLLRTTSSQTFLVIPVLVPGGMGKLKEPRRWHKPTLNKSQQFLVLRVLSTWGRRDSAVLILQLLCPRHFYYSVLPGVVVFHFLSLVFCNPPALAAGNWIQGLAIARQALCHWAKPWATFSLLTPDSYRIPLFLPDGRKSGVAAAINPMMAIFHPANFFLSFFFSLTSVAFRLTTMESIQGILFGHCPAHLPLEVQENTYFKYTFLS